VNLRATREQVSHWAHVAVIFDARSDSTPGLPGKPGRRLEVPTIAGAGTVKRALENLSSTWRVSWSKSGRSKENSATNPRFNGSLPDRGA
jgi:hypothetical protein